MSLKLWKKKLRDLKLLPKLPNKKRRKQKKQPKLKQISLKRHRRLLSYKHRKLRTLKKKLKGR